MRAFFLLPAILPVACAAAAQAGATDKLRPATAEDMQAAYAFAGCMASDRPVSTDRLLAGDDLPAMYTAIAAFAHGDDKCLARGRLRVGPSIVAGDLAEQRLRMGYTPDRFLKAVALDPGRPAVKARDESEAMAMCVTRTVPSDVYRLFRTVPGTPNELTAMQPLMIALPPCLSASTSMRINRVGLRSVLALGAYRLAKAGTASASGEKG